MAVYSGDVMIECYCPETPYDWEGAEITMYAVGDRLKLMVVDNLQNMKPLCEAIEIDLTK